MNYQNKRTKLPLNHLIEARLSMQTNQRYLADYKVNKFTYSYLTSKEFVEKIYKNWTEEKKQKFATIVAGTSGNDYRRLIEPRAEEGIV